MARTNPSVTIMNNVHFYYFFYKLHISPKQVILRYFQKCECISPLIINTLKNFNKQHIYSYLEIISISEEVVVSSSSPDVCPLVCSDSIFTMSERLGRNKGEEKLFQITEQQLSLVFLCACDFGLSSYGKNQTKDLPKLSQAISHIIAGLKPNGLDPTVRQVVI
jgi:hypothetical protein